MVESPSSPGWRFNVAALTLMLFGLLLVLNLRLLSALFAGLLVYELAHVVASYVPLNQTRSKRAKLVAVALIASLTIVAVTALISASVTFLRSDEGSIAALMQKMAETIEGSRATLPEWAQSWLPVGDPEALRAQLGEWLRLHAKELTALGGEAGRAFVHALIGMVIGALVSLHEVRAGGTWGPLAVAFVGCLARLRAGFRRVVFAQVRISALNAVLTALYLVVVLPLAGVHLPLTKTMIAFTFVAGLLPVVGNLVSNTVIVVISLGDSLGAALASLSFLVAIHKLEYFVNARIVGTRIHAAAWELLLAMLAMEAAFGLPGVVAAPVFYAYGKSELKANGWI